MKKIVSDFFEHPDVFLKEHEIAPFIDTKWEEIVETPLDYMSNKDE